MENEERQTIGCVKQSDCMNFRVKCSDCFETAGIGNQHPCYEHRDLVEVVRCKDCIGKAHWYQSDYGYTICGLSGLVVVEDKDFCSYGERRTDNG